jgi:hypothetical protein
VAHLRGAAQVRGTAQARSTAEARGTPLLIAPPRFIAPPLLLAPPVSAGPPASAAPPVSAGSPSPLLPQPPSIVLPPMSTKARTVLEMRSLALLVASPDPALPHTLDLIHGPLFVVHTRREGLLSERVRYCNTQAAKASRDALHESKASHKPDASTQQKKVKRS